jgi:hypothetical protein
MEGRCNPPVAEVLGAVVGGDGGLQEWQLPDMTCSALAPTTFESSPEPGRISPTSGIYEGISEQSIRFVDENDRPIGVVCSMSRKGNCWDNAVGESFFATVKTELVYQRRFATREEAREAIFEFIEVFYNRQRRHSSIGYLSPVDYEMKFEEEMRERETKRAA